MHRPIAECDVSQHKTNHHQTILDGALGIKGTIQDSAIGMKSRISS